MNDKRVHYISNEIIEYLSVRHGEGKSMDEMLRLEFNLPRTKKEPKNKASKYKFYMADLGVGESREFPQSDARDPVTGLDHNRYYAIHRSAMGQQKKYNMKFKISWGRGTVRVTRIQ